MCRHSWSKVASLTLIVMRIKKQDWATLGSKPSYTTENLCDLEQVHLTLTLCNLGMIVPLLHRVK